MASAIINNKTSIKDRINLFESYNESSIAGNLKDLFNSSKASIAQLTNRIDNISNKILHKAFQRNSRKKLIIILEKIKPERLADIIKDASKEELEKIVDNISDQKLPKVLSLLPSETVKQIMILIHGQEFIENLEKQQIIEEIIYLAENTKSEASTEKLKNLISNISQEDLDIIIENISNKGFVNSGRKMIHNFNIYRLKIDTV